MQTNLQPSSSNHHVVPIDRSIGKAGDDHKDAISLLSSALEHRHYGRLRSLFLKLIKHRQCNF